MARQISRKPSPGRVQDWISSVLNPIIDGLRRELGFLPRGPWLWNHHSRTLEHFNPVAHYVPDIYHDNFVDFISKHPRLPHDFKKHDQLLSELGVAVESTYQRLIGPGGTDARKLFEQAAIAQEGGREMDPKAFNYIAGYSASRVGRLPANYDHHQIYNENTALRDALDRASTKEQAHALAVAEQLLLATNRLHDGLISIRTRLADQYGARIRPVDPDVVGF